MWWVECNTMDQDNDIHTKWPAECNKNDKTKQKKNTRRTEQKVGKMEIALKNV